MSRANQMFCTIPSFLEKPCALSAFRILVWVSVDCLRFVSRVRDLKQLESVFSATCGFRNLRIKSGYKKSRVTSTRHDALCA